MNESNNTMVETNNPFDNIEQLTKDQLTKAFVGEWVAYRLRARSKNKPEGKPPVFRRGLVVAVGLPRPRTDGRVVQTLRIEEYPKDQTQPFKPDRTRSIGVDLVLRYDS